MPIAKLSGTRRPGKNALFFGGLAFFAAAALAQNVSAATNIFFRSSTPVIDSIGGGPIPGKYTAANGFHDGNTFNGAQFDGPVSTTLDSAGSLYVADKNNNAVRQVSLAGDTANSYTSTWLTNSYWTNYSKSQIIAVAEDPSDNLYILTKGTFAGLYKYNRFRNLIYSTPLALTNPTALAVQVSAPTNIFVSFTNGMLLNFVQDTAGAGIIASNVIVADGGFNWHPAGLAVKLNGQILVSDLASNAIYTINNVPGATPVNVLGTAYVNPYGWVDGAAAYASFNQPCGVAVASDGSIVVADFGNNAVRMIDTNLNVFTVYGTTTNNWGAQFPNYPGWLDGTPGNTKTNASSRQPISVTLSRTGLLFVTDLKFNVLRDVTGLGLSAIVGGSGTGGGGGGGGTNNTIPPTVPTITPSYGYFPQCQTIVVSNNFGSVYYTVDATEPTTNSFAVPMVGGVGSILWCDTTHDLTFLRVKAFNDTLSSITVGGTSSPTNQIGFTTTAVAGIGATAIIPIVMNLQPGVTLRSLQYRVEVTPMAGNPNPAALVDILSTGTNDFIQYAGVASGIVTNVLFPYTTTSNGQGFVVTALANTSGMSAQNYGSPALLAVTIPGSCTEGMKYKLDILFPSGTSDGIQAIVPLGTMASQTLVISNRSYLAGDSSFGQGYNAGEFGSGRLNNADVNNALYAAAGIHIPYTFSDVYNSMDVYPQSPSIAGDKFITFLDWSTILFRSEFLDTNAWMRSWSAGGLLTSTEIDPVLPGFAPKSPVKTTPPGQVWLSHATFGSSTITNAIPGNFYSLPVYAKILPGYSLGGYQFRATVTADGAAPAPGSIAFTGAWLPGLSPNDIVCYAPLGSLSPPLQNSNTLGQIVFQVPPTAVAGQSYTLHFSYVDGAPNLTTPYHLESMPGSIWVLGPALRSAPVISDEWKIKFFGSTTNPAAADNADPDGDGQSNLQEYLAGTDPTSASSRLQFTHVHSGQGSGRTVALDWLSAPAKNYLLQSAPSLDSTNWTTVGTYTGDGNTQESIQNNNSEKAKFYRLRLQP